MSEATLDSGTMIADNSTPGFFKLKPVFTLLSLVALVYWGYLSFMGSESHHLNMINSFMYGWIFWLMATLGCLALTLIHHSLRSMWTLPVLRVFEAGSSPWMFGALAFFYVPVRLHMSKVYEWVNPSDANYVVKFKQAYLNQGFFDFRFAAAFILLAGLSWFLQKSSTRQDASLNENEAQLRCNVASPGIVFFALITTFLLTDVGMSLTPNWYSTMYPLWLLVGGAQTALTLAIIMVTTAAEKAPYKDSMSSTLTKDLGNMMFLCTMLWGYTSVSQLIILWNGNLPDTAIFYAHRGVDAKLGWNYIGASTILGCFLIPFVTLLSPRIKMYYKRLQKIAIFIFCFRIVDVFWIIAASLAHREWNTAIPTVGDIAGLVLLGFVWFAVMLTKIQKHPLLPLYDNRLKEAKANAH
jgi:hypothetical protein